MKDTPQRTPRGDPRATVPDLTFQSTDGTPSKTNRDYLSRAPYKFQGTIYVA